jgi:hypothetical protein
MNAAPYPAVMSERLKSMCLCPSILWLKTSPRALASHDNQAEPQDEDGLYHVAHLRSQLSDIGLSARSLWVPMPVCGAYRVRFASHQSKPLVIA